MHARLDSIVLKTGLMGILAMQFHAETSEIPPGPFTMHTWLYLGTQYPEVGTLHKLWFT